MTGGTLCGLANLVFLNISVCQSELATAARQFLSTV